MLNWNKELWLIDHGASLYFHHNWSSWRNYLERGFPTVKDHVLLQRANGLEEVAGEIKALISPKDMVEIVDNLPEDWLEEEESPLSASEKRAAYVEYLQSRLERLDFLAKEAADAR